MLCIACIFVYCHRSVFIVCAIKELLTYLLVELTLPLNMILCPTLQTIINLLTYKVEAVLGLLRTTADSPGREVARTEWKWK